MNIKSELSALRSLIANLPPEVEPPRHAEEEALRLIVRLGLSHPMTLAATLKLVATEMPHGRVGEIERTARALYALLQKQRERKGPPR